MISHSRRYTGAVEPAVTPRPLRLPLLASLRQPLLALLTVLALCLHGFHPYAEDGGVYLPGIKRVLHPALYGAQPVFVLAPMRTSLFAPLVAVLVRLTRLPLPWMILLLYSLSILLTLWAALRIAERLTESLVARAAAVALLACWLTLPIAGTSLLLMDPYLTARSLTTPLVLLALGAALGRQWGHAFLALVIAAALHPLMAGYGVAAVAAIFACSCKPPRQMMLRSCAVIFCGLALAGILTMVSGREDAQYRIVVMTRYYWFLSQWHWYEVLGLMAPLLLLCGFAGRSGSSVRTLARAALLLGVTSTLVALTFARATMANHLVARLQPLRALQLVYIVMILYMGAWLGEHLLKTERLRWLLLLALASAPIGYAAHETYANSDHFEVPGRTPRNQWQQAFLWVRDHTPPDALFTMDPFYITQGIKEDAQTFRAIAERDVLPDYSKDGGEAAVAPALTEAWARGVTAQTNLDREGDAARIKALRTLRPDWAILQAQSSTTWHCPYRNSLVKVCALPAWTP